MLRSCRPRSLVSCEPDMSNFSHYTSFAISRRSLGIYFVWTLVPCCTRTCQQHAVGCMHLRRPVLLRPLAPVTKAHGCNTLYHLACIM